MASHRFVAVVGARVLPETSAPQVAAVVRFFVGRAWGIGTGGAGGADEYALEAIVATGRLGCARSVVFLPGAVGAARTAALRCSKQRNPTQS
jgi:predicted Rossmann fold nucleotide-binding protein DprA/Smf involved in DNA uptake